MTLSTIPALGRKQSSTHEQFQAAFDGLEETLPRVKWEATFARAVQRVRQLKSHYGQAIAFAWSGGKDSLALELVCREAGIRDCCYGMTKGLEYPAFLAWVTDHMPERLTVFKNEWDLAWLAEHQAMLFPQNAATAAKWFSGIQHAAQEQYTRERGLACLILGRRRIDGNYIGRKPGEWVYSAAGVTRASPIHDWTHEDVFGAIRYGLGWGMAELPPFYRWPRGWRCGTNAWPARQWCGSIQDGWREVASIDPGIVSEAARLIPSAADFILGQEQ